jgi:predicted DNA-binding antitoxin AbrB/MazE fold protein
MAAVLATYRNGKVKLSEPVGWPEGTQVEVVTIPPAAASKADSYRDFILRLAGSFGDEPFERPPQGDNEQREEW